ncbi:Uma2 family endonuclease [Pseudonocardia endophytica]|uniref:Uma2 family endonuclease n=1 Tax=Pseudonocardia endophytica TaxID=401976 RepID=A0A4R1I414_PSEEN|nr:Uma2 family endonuclease [Pseudonocardia endophytica]TCK27269.1 Uma2 family endonuclease [Pseudonocardia endophytica]
MTEALSWPRHQITIEEWDALREAEDLRLEVMEGILVIAAQPYGLHQRAERYLANDVEAGVPTTFSAVHEVEVLLTEQPLTIRVPDVVVVPTALVDGNPHRYPAADVQLAVEILSEGSRRVDRVTKFSEYADAGIPQYWIVDLDDPITLTAYLLVDGDYELVAEATGSVDLDVTGHPVHIDVAALTRR